MPDAALSLPDPQVQSQLDLRDGLHPLAPSAILAVVDQTVFDLHADTLRAQLPSAHWHILPSGEAHKTLATCQVVWDACHQHKLDRQALILCIGGGMALDLAAWCAASWKRGIRFGYVPTTLLAMVDAAHGGKVGIDYHGGKNLLGAFAAPEFVICATDFLRTLPPRELAAGYAEVLKHALLGASDAETLLATDPASLSPADWTAIVEASAAFKLSIVRDDPFERGARQLLNFGHTVGHALESTLLDTPHALLHGEAVGLGMAVELILSAANDELKHKDAWRLAEQLRERYPHALPPNFDWNTYQQHLLQDKKNRDGELRLVTLSAIGRANYGRSVPLEAVVGATREVLG